LKLISVDATGDHPANGWSGGPVFSPDGSELAFASNASNLGPPDLVSVFGGSYYDAFVRDLTTGEVTLVSANTAGTNSGNGDSGGPVFSPDGTKVLFFSWASDLGPADTNSEQDIYLRDLAPGTTSLVSQNATGTSGGNGLSRDASFTPDGRSVVFASTASDFGPVDTNGTDGNASDIYRRDLTTGAIDLISVNVNGASGDRASTAPVVSPNGRYVAFTSEATDLVPGMTTSAGDLFVRDLVAGTTKLVSAAPGGGGGNGLSDRPVFSPDSRQIAYESRASNLGPVDHNGVSDIYVTDLTTGATGLVSDDASGTEAADGQSLSPVFSPDGDHVGFTTTAANFGPDDTNGTWDLYLRDLATGTTSLVSATATGHAGNRDSFCPLVFGPTGDTVVFGSSSSDLDPIVTTVTNNLYARDLATGHTTLISANADRTDGGNGASGGCDVGGTVFGPDDATIAFVSQSAGLVPIDAGGGQDDVYVAQYRDLARADLSTEATTSPTQGHTGQTLTYHFTVTNHGPDPAPNVTIAHLLPTTGFGLATVTSDTAACSPFLPGPNGSRLTECKIATLAAGHTADITVTATVTATAGTTLSQTIAARSVPSTDAGPSPNAALATTTVTP
jgi:uncharacterized repeat protein (TIGR01451 family)